MQNKEKGKKKAKKELRAVYCFPHAGLTASSILWRKFQRQGERGQRHGKLSLHSEVRSYVSWETKQAGIIHKSPENNRLFPGNQTQQKTIIGMFIT